LILAESHNVTTTVQVTTLTHLQLKITSEKKNAGTPGSVRMRIRMIAMGIVTEKGNPDVTSFRKCVGNISMGCFLFAIGSIIYVCFGSEELFLYDWFNINSHSAWITFLRDRTGDIAIPKWLIFNGPDFLWLLSYLLINRGIWSNKENLYRRSFACGMCCLAIFSEWLQYHHIIPGSGDWFDVISYILATIIYKIIRL